MKKFLQIKFILPILIISLVLAYYLVLPAFIVVEKDEAISFNLPENPQQSEALINPQESLKLDILSQTDFQAAEHQVQGQALIMQQGQQRILRFENFETINGPSLHIYLVDTQKLTPAYDLGPIKATKGNVNYPIPDDLDLSQFNQIQVYCVPFKKVFSFAEFKI